ncbi:MAG: type IV pilin protein [Candidatus Saccharimonadales bacterium]
MYLFNEWSDLMAKYGKKSHGFTIVELLIVIAVIGILATIVTIGYNGAVERSRETVLQSDLTNAANQMELDRIHKKTYATSESAVDDGNGLPKSAGTSYELSVNNAAGTFCITATSSHASTKQYSVTQTGIVAPGSCPGHASGPSESASNGEVDLSGVTIEILGWDQSSQHDANINIANLADKSTTGVAVTGGYKIDVRYDTPCNTPTDGTYEATLYSASFNAYGTAGVFGVDGPGGSCEFSAARFYEVFITGITSNGETGKKQIKFSNFTFPYGEYDLYWGN